MNRPSGSAWSTQTIDNLLEGSTAIRAAQGGLLGNRPQMSYSPAITNPYHLRSSIRLSR